MRVSRGTLIKSAVIGSLVVLVFLLTMTLTESTPPSKITLAGGQIDSSYDRASRDLAVLVAAHHGPTVDILDTAGSVGNLKRIAADEVDAALLEVTELARKLNPRYQHAIYDFRLHAGLVRQDGLDRLAKLAA